MPEISQKTAEEFQKALSPNDDPLSPHYEDEEEEEKVDIELLQASPQANAAFLQKQLNEEVAKAGGDKQKDWEVFGWGNTQKQEMEEKKKRTKSENVEIDNALDKANSEEARKNEKKGLLGTLVNYFKKEEESKEEKKEEVKEEIENQIRSEENDEDTKVDISACGDLIKEGMSLEELQKVFLENKIEYEAFSVNPKALI